MRRLAILLSIASCGPEAAMTDATGGTTSAGTTGATTGTTGSGTNSGRAWPASSSRATAIDLEFHVAPHCDARDNCEVEQAAFTWSDPRSRPNTGTVVDLHLACQ